MDLPVDINNSKDLADPAAPQESASVRRVPASAKNLRGDEEAPF
jgi:hypothetical protein